MSGALVRVVIVNYNGGDFLAKAVESVRRQTVPCEVVVVDNASADESLDRLVPFEALTILRSPRNLGFGAGVNFGARDAATPFLATLNPDAVASPVWLERTIAWMVREHVELGTCLIGAGEGYYFTGGTWNRWRGAAISCETPRDRRPDWINGCALIVARPLFERLRGFDEGYFLYSEDVDLSLRARSAGATLGVLGERLVEHEQHGRSAVSLGDRKLPIAFVSRGRLVGRHVSPLARPLAFVIQALVVPAIWSRNIRVTLRLAGAFARGFASCRSTRPPK